MKKVLLSLFVVCGALMANSTTHTPKKMPKMFQSVSISDATILQDGKSKMFCPKCGMTLPMFYKSNMSAKVDGKVKQYCSIHCLVDDMSSGAKVSDIKVVDVASLKFVDAKSAYFVVGSSKKGTMTKVSKYAFATKKDALDFASKFGGNVMDFEQTLALSKKQFAKESAMIGKKQAMMAKKGKMIYNAKCQKIDEKFNSTAEAKAYIIEHKSCQGLNGKQLQAVGLYLNNK
jgi:hypothetical protein